MWARVRAALLPLALVLAGSAALTWWAGSAAAAPTTARSAREDRGRELFVTSCSSCHGVDGEGVTASNGEVRGPSLRHAGEAAAYYQLSTGRMPLADSDDQPLRKPPAFDRADIDALVAYVASLGDGPALPQVDPAGADLAAGGEIFRANCAPCHSASGAGGALSYGEAAPHLGEATALQVGAAVRSGPGQMPVFGRDVIDDRQLDQVAAYVKYLRHPDDRGGVPIGRTGPVPEGFVALTLGLGALVAFVAWIGTFAPARRRRDA
jgi:ubiquinol-cytochrome c reductase cytochrome c subunit